MHEKRSSITETKKPGAFLSVKESDTQSPGYQPHLSYSEPHVAFFLEYQDRKCLMQITLFDH